MQSFKYQAKTKTDMIKALLPTAFALVLALTNSGAPEVNKAPDQSSLYQTAEQLRRPEIWEIDRSNPFEADEYTDEEYQEYDNRTLTPNTLPETLAAPSYSLTNFVVAPGVVQYAPDQSNLYKNAAAISRELYEKMDKYNFETDPDNIIYNSGYNPYANDPNDSKD